MSIPNDTTDSAVRLIHLTRESRDSGHRPDLPAEQLFADAQEAMTAVASLDPHDAPFVAVVAPGTILNHGFLNEIATAIADPALENLPWVALVSDGVDIEGRHIDTGNSLDDPAVPKADPIRIARWSDPAVAIIDVAALGSISAAAGKPGNIPDLVRAAGSQSLPVFLSPWLRSSSLRKRAITPPVALSGLGHDPAIDIDPSSVRPDPSISIVVRTTLERPELLRRNLAALDVQHNGSAVVEVLLTSTAGEEELAAAEASAASRHPDLPLRRVGASSEDVPSRSAALIAGLEAARGDYVWFVDDDDWIADGALKRVKRSVHGVDRPILIGAVDAFDETWSDGDIVASERIRTYLPEEWYRAFTGWNFLPNCSVVAPRALALDRVSTSPIIADLGEDYALQLLLLSAPGSAVQVVEGPIANVSVRADGDNAVTLEDRTPWLRDLGTHISNLMRDPAASTAAFWRLGHAVRELPYPEEAPSGTDGAANEPDAAWQPHPLARFVPGRVRPTIARVRRQFRNPE